MDLVYTIEDGRVGGRPGPMRAPWDLAALKRDGWTAIVSFECNHLDPAEIRAAGFEHKLLCVEDFTAPTIDQMVEFNEFVDRTVRDGGKATRRDYLLFAFSTLALVVVGTAAYLYSTSFLYSVP